MSTSDQDRPTSRTFSFTRLALAIIVILLIAAVSYRIGVSSIASGPANERVLKLFGLGNPTTNRLDARFNDADGDLVADPPTDPAEWVDPDTLYFSFVAAKETERYKQVWAGFADHLARQTGKRVQYVTLESPDEQLEALKDGRLHVTGLNTGNVPNAVNAYGFVPVCTLGGEDGSYAYTMKIIVPANSPIRAIKDLRGHTLTMTEPSSNSGSKAPLVLLMSDFDLQPERDYRIIYSYGHDASIQGVASGKYEMAAVASDMLARAVGRDENIASQVRVIYESEPFPAAGLGYVCNLKPELAAKVREAFFNFDWSGTGLESEFASSGVQQFVPVSYKDDWALIRRIDDTVGYRYAVTE